MNPGDASSVRSPLDKPLSELTEEDIAQLTREDCRRFLKQKGMRRPSWNKSQAIQQVISLKTLLEDRPDYVLPKNHNPMPPPPVTSPQVSVPPTRVAEDPSPYRRHPNTNTSPNPILPPPLFTCASHAAHTAEEHQFPSNRDDPARMTIIYDDTINVYNDVTVEKARAIVQLAASRVAIDLNDQPPEPVHPRINPAGIGPGQDGRIFPSSHAGSGPLEWTSPREMEDTDCPTGRQASLQRYCKKRKDRYKRKRIIGGSPSSMELMLLSQKYRGQTPNEQSSQSNTSSLTQPRPSCIPTRCSSIENQGQKFRFSVDLNDDGGGR